MLRSRFLCHRIANARRWRLHGASSQYSSPLEGIGQLEVARLNQARTLGSRYTSRGGTTEERGFLVSGRAGCEPLAGIPKDRVATPALLHRKIALEHASASAKIVRRKLRRRAATPPRSPPRKAVRRRSSALSRLAEREALPASQRHCRDAQALSCPTPFGKDLGRPSRIGAAQNRTAEMVQDNWRTRKSCRQARQPRLTADGKPTHRK